MYSDVGFDQLGRESCKYTIVQGDSMGRGDKRTRRGKIFKASYGNVRPKATKPGAGARSKTAQAGTAAKKAPVTKKSK